MLAGADGGKGELGAVSIVRLILCAIGFVIFGWVVSTKVYVHLPALLQRIPASKYESLQPRDELHLTVMLGTLCLILCVTLVKVRVLGAAGS